MYSRAELMGLAEEQRKYYERIRIERMHMGEDEFYYLINNLMHNRNDTRNFALELKRFVFWQNIDLDKFCERMFKNINAKQAFTRIVIKSVPYMQKPSERYD